MIELTRASGVPAVQARASKHRKKDILPLHPEFAEMLKKWTKDLSPDGLLFPNLLRRKTSIMIQKDLARAGIPYKTDDGIADFHAAGRHTHITELLRNGVSLVEAKELARHSDIQMTMKYTHIGLEDQAEAVKKLPGIEQPSNSEPPEKCLHIVCNCEFTDSQSEASTDKDCQENTNQHQSQSLCKNKDNSMDCQSMAAIDIRIQQVGVTGFEPATF